MSMAAFPDHNESLRPICAALLACLVLTINDISFAQPTPADARDLWSIVAVGPDFVICTSAGAHLVNGSDFTVRSIAEGRASAAYADGRIAIGKSTGEGTSLITVYKLDQGRAMLVGNIDAPGIVSGVTPSPCFAPYRFAISTITPPCDFRTFLIRIGTTTEDTDIAPIPIVSSIATFINPDGMVFAPRHEHPGIAISCFLADPAAQVLPQVQNMDSDCYRPDHIVMISGAALLRGWRVAPLWRAKPIAYSGDGSRLLIMARDTCMIVSTTTGQTEREFNLDRARVLAADSDLKNLIAIEDTQVFWIDENAVRTPLFVTQREYSVAIFLDHAAAITDGHHLWIATKEGAVAHPLVADVSRPATQGAEPASGPHE
jgi:hypothetical protein